MLKYKDMRKQNLIILLLIPLVILSWSQGCSQVGFTSFEKFLAQSTKLNASDTGNGGTYDGKPRILHHYVKDFRCAGKVQPESILIRKNLTDWVIIRNSREQCAFIDQAPVEGVVFDEVKKQANFENQLYVPPRPYIVDPNEDPNLADAKLIDGVCEDSNGKCSLTAALQTAGLVANTASVQVIVPAGIYKLTQTLQLALDRHTNTIQVTGQDSGSSILDGQGAIEIMRITGWTGTALVENLSFQYGFAQSTVQASALESSLFSGRVIVNNCLFQSNLKAHTFYASGFSDVEFHKSILSSNHPDFGVLFFFAINSVLLDQVIVDNNTAMVGVWVTSSGQSHVEIQSSSVTQNDHVGISLENCSACKIENSTIAENGANGLNIYANRPIQSPMATVNQVTLFHNGLAGGLNLDVSYDSSSNYKLTVMNSIIAQDNSSRANCNTSPAPGLSRRFFAAHNLFDDLSCNVSTSDNILAPPLLGPLKDNGGFASTFLPDFKSPVIDAGDNSTCATLDQRGLVRPIDKLGHGAICDLGAVEVQ